MEECTHPLAKLKVRVASVYTVDGCPTCGHGSSAYGTVKLRCECEYEDEFDFDTDSGDHSKWHAFVVEQSL